jgi:hypothetical protein
MTNEQRPQSAPKSRRPGAVARTSGAKASPQRTQARTDAGRDACRPGCRNSWFLALHHHSKRPARHLDHSEHDSVHQPLGHPFILLNLVLSFQAAYAAPIIMMSQNRQSEIDRRHAEHDYRINVKAELESNCCTTRLTPCVSRKSYSYSISFNVCPRTLRPSLSRLSRPKRCRIRPR